MLKFYMFFNDVDMSKWKEIDLNVDSLWIINERDKSGKHKNIYHGNFIPQIPNQLIKRYTKKDEVVFEPFMGSGTTLFECENLGRKYVGFDINKTIVEYVKKNMEVSNKKNDFYFSICDSTNEIEFDDEIDNARRINFTKYQFLIMHPPYLDIIKFSENKKDFGENWKKYAIENPVKVAEYLYKYQDEGRFGAEPRLFLFRSRCISL